VPPHQLPKRTLKRTYIQRPATFTGASNDVCRRPGLNLIKEPQTLLRKGEFRRATQKLKNLALALPQSITQLAS
jgi:hypothetical protein